MRYEEREDCGCCECEEEEDGDVHFGCDGRIEEGFC